MATNPNFEPLRGHCTCKAITYTLTAAPLITHCCHCTYCQRETGSAFAINSMIEAYNFRITSTAKPTLVGVPSSSSPTGDKHLVASCHLCMTGIYAHYSGNKTVIFVKAGTLSDESRGRVSPDAHIFTSTKMEWVDLSKEEEKGRVFSEFYERDEIWSEESLDRRKVLLEWAAEQKNHEVAQE
ncbi:hypothetical protein N0V90_005672 [Kalmusia sp. IMI 367209]|nr:hypothetical protein N0V90_005672 [Kalmusia sp. IMI 367209]